MVEVRQYRKDMSYKGYDSVYEGSEDFEAVLPFMLPRIEGEWNILILEPKMDFVRVCLDAGIVPNYITLTLAVEPSQLEQLYMERPKLTEQDKSPWQIYLGLIAHFPNGMEDKAMRELYYRVGPSEDKLAEALEQLKDVQYVTVKEIDKRWTPVERVYASQVVRTFLTGKRSVAWTQLRILESEIGMTVAFYAMRKAVRRLFNSKAKYLRNQQVKERYISQVSIYDITRLYWLFEEATDPYQLYPILQMFERRQQPYVSC